MILTFQEGLHGIALILQGVPPPRVRGTKFCVSDMIAIMDMVGAQT
jgi:hypothetical protein